MKGMTVSEKGTFWEVVLLAALLSAYFIFLA